MNEMLNSLLKQKQNYSLNQNTNSVMFISAGMHFLLFLNQESNTLHYCFRQPMHRKNLEFHHTPHIIATFPNRACEFISAYARQIFVRLQINLSIILDATFSEIKYTVSF